MRGPAKPADPEQIKSCCAAIYQSDFARLLLGDSFHPGGLGLTERLGELLELKAGSRALDVASGRGESAIFLAQRFGCRVAGVDLGAENVAEAKRRAAEAGVGDRTEFRPGDAERIDFPDATFDAVICECAFCTFPDKRQAASEIARILKPGGRAGLSDLTRSGPLPGELEGLLAWVACIADARPSSEYAGYLEAAGLCQTRVESHDEALAEMVRAIQGRLLATELMVKVQQQDRAEIDFDEAKKLARSAAEAVRSGLLGYSVILARKEL